MVLSTIAAGDPSQITPVQYTHVFLLFYTNYTHTSLIPVRVLLIDVHQLSVQSVTSCQLLVNLYDGLLLDQKLFGHRLQDTLCVHRSLYAPENGNVQCKME